MGVVTFTHDTEMLTRAPMLPCTIDRARVWDVGPAVRDWLGSSGFEDWFSGMYANDVCRIARIWALGATPISPSVGAGAAPMMPATIAPCPSQSSWPLARSGVVHAKPPPAIMPGSRGWGRTPVSMTATITPAPVENLWVCSICSAVNGGGVSARSEFGSTPPTTQAPFLRMGPSGPGGPSGGAAARSGGVFLLLLRPRRRFPAARPRPTR